MTPTLKACGGNSEGSCTPPPTVEVRSVNSAVNILVEETGVLKVEGSSATAQAFDLTASIGDSWRLVLNQDGTYRVQVLPTQFGLAGAHGTFTRTENGSVVHLRSNAFDLQLDQRTQAITGGLTLGHKRSDVVGSGYAMPANTATLAGDYVYLSATHSVSGGSSHFSGGNFRIAANGTDVTLCVDGLINNATGHCETLPGTDAFEQVALKLVADKPSKGLFILQRNGEDLGIMHFQAGNRGPVLLVDRLSGNAQVTKRTGSLYAVRKQTLHGNEMDGTWECFDKGNKWADIVIQGNSMSATGPLDKTKEILHYNKLIIASGARAAGMVSSVVPGESDAVLLLPLSASLFAVELDRGGTSTAGICQIKG